MELIGKDITKTFSDKIILDKINFQIKKGELFGLLGPNGAGKTTLIRIILNIFNPDSGEIIFNTKNKNLTIKEKIGYLPEEGGLYKTLTVIECINYFAKLKGVEKPQKKAESLLKRLNLYESKDTMVKALSKGMQRKLQFIIAIINDPEIFILDEPFYGLDPVNQKLIKDMIIELKNKGMTIIMSTHQMDEVEKMCENIIMINKGHIVLQGSVDKIKESNTKFIEIQYTGKFSVKLKGAKNIEDTGKIALLEMNDNTKENDILKELIEKDVEIKSFKVKSKSLNQIFIEEVNRK